MASYSDHPVSRQGGPSSGTTSHDPRCKKRGNVLVRIQDKSYRRATTISTLPDGVLLEIFDSCRINHHHDRMFPFHPVWDWHRLVRVCRRWRQIVFASPRRLDLQILCTHRTPLTDVLGYWPAFRIAIVDILHNLTSHDEDNIIAALEHPERVRRVQLGVTGSQLGDVVAVMQDPFPALTHLWLSSKDEDVPVLDDGFLGGSAPCLREIYLDGIPFPSLPTWTHISSVTDLVSLQLCNIPKTGFIPPEAMVTCLATMTELKDLRIEFRSPTLRRPDLRRLAEPQTRVVLSVLTSLKFQGDCEYLEDLVAQFETPRLDSIEIKYFNQFLDFQLPQLLKLINLSEDRELTLFRQAEITFGRHRVSLNLHHESRPHRRPITVSISCERVDWQVSQIAQVANQFSTILSDVVRLGITQVEQSSQLEGMEDTKWLQLFRPFTAVRMLRVSREFTGHVALALGDVTKEMVAKVLPALDLLCLVGQPVSSSSIEKFVAVRRDSYRPVTIVSDPWEYYKRLHLSR